MVYLLTFTIRINQMRVCKYTNPMDPMGYDNLNMNQNAQFVSPQPLTSPHLG